MRLFKKSMVVLGISVLALGFAGCGKKEIKNIEANTSNNKINIGTTETSEPILRAAADLMKEKGYEVEISLFDNNTLCVTAANDGSTDGTFNQHIKFIESFNSANDGDLVMVQPYAYYTGIGLYSEKYNSLEEIPDGATIAIMNDAMNMDRGLKMMQDAGLITLGEKGEMGYTILDIIDNSKNLNFLDMEQSQTVRSLPDVDAAIVFFTHMSNAGKDFTTYLYRDQDAADFPMGLSVKEVNKDQTWAKDLAECLTTDEVKDVVIETFGGVFEFYDN